MLVTHDLNTLVRKHGPNIEYFQPSMDFSHFPPGFGETLGVSSSLLSVNRSSRFHNDFSSIYL